MTVEFSFMQLLSNIYAVGSKLANTAIICLCSPYKNHNICGNYRAGLRHPYCYIMTGMSFIAACAVSLLCTQVFSQQGQATGTCMHGCSTEEMRRDEVNKVLDKSGCKNYSCGKPLIFA